MSDIIKNKKTLYLECYSGISGDMAVGALLDLGADISVLNSALMSLDIGGFETKISRVSKSGIDACDFDVVLEHDNHDHDDEYLYGNGSMCHDHHEHRGLNSILKIIDSSKISPNAKDLAKKIFAIIADAESEVHGVPKEDVHFHEVGAVDSIVDIVSFAVCFDNLGITDVIVPGLYEGKGVIRCQHGILPIPVPAVSSIVAKHDITMHNIDSEKEYVTPTGAAIVAAVRTSDELPDGYKIESIGIGAGKRKTDRSGTLRAMIVSESSAKIDSIFKLECNIDDCSGEAFGFAMDRLMDAGARDVHYIPVFMKKNRPAYLLNVICKEDDIARLEEIIFSETTTIGIRRIRMDRSILERKIVTVNTPLGDVRVKVCDCVANVRYYPEYDDVANLCKKHSLPYQTVYQMAQVECIRKYEKK